MGAAGAVILWTASAHAGEAACVAVRENAAGQYAACQSKARATEAVVGLTKYRIRYDETWAKLKARNAGASCNAATRSVDDDDGTVFTVCLSALNNGGGFAGANDWRLPTIQALQTIMLPEVYPCVTSPCTVPELGPDSSSGYWSATTHAPYPMAAWHANTFYGGANLFDPERATCSFAPAPDRGLSLVPRPGWSPSSQRALRRDEGVHSAGSTALGDEGKETARPASRGESRIQCAGTTTVSVPSLEFDG